MKGKYLLFLMAIIFLILAMLTKQLNIGHYANIIAIIFGILAIVFSLVAAFIGITKK